MKSLLDYVNQFNLSLDSKDTTQKQMNITKKVSMDDVVLQQEIVSTTSTSVTQPNGIPHPKNTPCGVCRNDQKSLLKKRLLSALNDKAMEEINSKRPVLKRACKEQKFFCYTPLQVLLLMSILTFTLTNAKGTLPVKSVKKVMKLQNTAMVKTSKIGKALVNSIFNSGARENLMQNLHEGNSFLKFIQQAIKSAPRKALAEVSKNELLLCKPIVGNQICFSECSKSGGGKVKYSYDFCYTSHTSNNWEICECTFRQEVLNYLKLVKNKLLTHSTYQSAQNTMLWLVLTILATIIGVCVLLLFIRCMCIYYNFRTADGRPGAPRKSILRRQKVRFEDAATQKSTADEQLHTHQPARPRPTTLFVEQPNETTTTNQQQELTITRIN